MNLNETQICHKGTGFANPSGKHSQLLISKTAWPLQSTTFQTTIMPWPCNETPIDPERTKTSQKYTTQLFQIPQANQNLKQYHFASEVDSVITDTNALNYPDTTILTVVNAKSIFFSYSTNTHVQNKSCVSELNFRKLQMQDGKLFTYNDTTYIESDNLVDLYYEFLSKFSYKGFISASTSTIVKFYIPDGIMGYDMSMVGEGISSSYDDTTKILTATVSSGFHRFAIRLTNLCLADCYFPPTEVTIDDLFSFNDHSTQTLAHKLDIVKPNGNLTISSSQMEISCNSYLRNKDTLIIEGACDDDWALDPCEGVGFSYTGTSHGALIVNSGSALVLSNGSYTRIGNNSGIIIKSGGTLVVDDGAFLQVGDDNDCDKGGKLIVESGGSVQIHPYAHLEFIKIVGDTEDLQTINFSMSASAGINWEIDSLLRVDTIIDTTFTSIPICSLNYVLSPAVLNNDWGYVNFMPPIPNIQLRNDTLCPGETMIIDLRRVLNDKKFWFEVCRVDSFIKYDKNGSPFWADTCIVDTISDDTIYENPPCKSPRQTPDYFFYRFKTGSLHRVTIKIDNDCGLSLDSVTFVYVKDTPHFTLVVPEFGCAGIGNIKATTGQDYTGDYSWRVVLLDSSGGIPLNLKGDQNLNVGLYWDSSGTIPDTFDFPGFNFRGGRKYLISLTVNNECGEITKSDTVDIPTGAYIVLDRPLAFAQPVNGAISIQLHGYISNSDTFRWEPATWLDDTSILTPTSTPLDSITYILIAHSGTCLATDTVHIKYNRYDNAGYNDTLCFDSNTVSTEMVIGFPYDMSLFLGILYYYSPTDFMTYYNAHNISNNPLYLRYFTHYMHYSTYKDQSSSCPVDLYNLFTNTIDKELFFKQSWFKSFYVDFTSFSDPTMPALATFNTAIHADPALSSLLDGLDNWTNILPCIDGVFLEYDNYVAGHSGEITTSWSKIVDEDTTTLSSWDDYFMAVDAPTKSSTYVLSVITPDYAEIDEITVLLDTSLNVSFEPAMQFDSTAYFMNYTDPQSSVTTFEWDFGDGSTHSTDINPIHTFPAFDTSFRVCLSANNRCGTWVYCDTVWLDSAHWGGSLFREKASNATLLSSKQNQEQLQNNLMLKASGQAPIALSNFPNPFGTSSIIDYEIWQTFSTAELKITNMLGQQVFSQKLIKPIDKIQIDGAALNDGMYYYSIIIDGSVKLTKFMAVMH